MSMDKTQTIERGGRRWWVRPEAAAPLLDRPWPLDRPQDLVLVKRGHHRAVWTLRLPNPAGAVPEAAFFVKTYEAGGPVRQLVTRLGFGPGRREWDVLVAAREAGLDVPEPVALSRGATETLVTRAIAGGQRLDEYLFDRYFEPRPDDPPYPGARPPELVSIFRRRRRPPEGTIGPPALARALADLVARLAGADLYLPDLHPGNILISGSPGAWRLSLVDLAEAESAAPPEALLNHLMQLEHFFEPIASAGQRLRCLVRLGQLATHVPAAQDVAQATARYRLRFYRHRDRRTRRESKYFRRVASDGWRGWATADWAETAVRLVAHYGPGPYPEAAEIKKGRTATVWRVALAAGRALFIKRHNRVGEKGLAATVIGPSRSLASFRKGHAMLARGIATARPAAALDLRQGGAIRDTLLMTEPVNGEPLSDWLKRGPPATERHRVTWLLARMIRRLHDAGFSHRDLKAPNILVASAGGPEVRPVLVDLDGLRGGRKVSARRRTQNLMRLSVSLEESVVARRTDCLRFLRTYLGRCGCPREIAVLRRRRGSTRAARRLRRWWDRIARLSAHKVATLKRKGAWMPDKPKAD
jgi:tRNA A-37 threonylcarbamoyl transferase component Bud32